MDIIQLYRDFNIDHVTEGHKHCREGWVNIECPFCVGNPGYHLGYNLQANYFHCWRCGGKYAQTVISKLLNVPTGKARSILQQYDIYISSYTAPDISIVKKSFKYPSGTDELADNHIRYLQKRNFDPDLLIDLWQLKGTGPISRIESDGKKIDYKHRIIIPYEWNGEIVSFDSRSIAISGSDKERYKACPKDREIIEHKKILYGKQYAWKDAGICLEGPTDVWRLGPLSFCTSGIQYTPEQVRIIAKAFKRVFVIFDPEPQAQVQANKLSKELEFRGLETIIISDLKGDPGSMPQDEADYLVKQLIK